MGTNVDLILKNATLLTMDKNLTQYNPGAVAITGEKIIDVGTSQEIENKYDSTTAFDCKGMVLMPGLINTHTHIPMTLLRGLADDLRLEVWLLGYVMPVEREFVSISDIHKSIATISVARCLNMAIVRIGLAD